MLGAVWCGVKVGAWTMPRCTNCRTAVVPLLLQALYDGQYIDAHFTRSFYKHLLAQVGGCWVLGALRMLMIVGFFYTWRSR